MICFTPPYMIILHEVKVDECITQVNGALIIEIFSSLYKTIIHLKMSTLEKKYVSRNSFHHRCIPQGSWWLLFHRCSDYAFVIQSIIRFLPKNIMQWVYLNSKIVLFLVENIFNITDKSDPWQNVFVLPAHDDVIKWKHFLRYWPFVLGVHRSPVNSPHKGQ